MQAMNLQRNRFIAIVLLVILVNALLVYSMTGVAHLKKASRLPLNIPVRNGDLVMRRGKGLVSNWFSSCSTQDQSFSHAGVVLMKNNIPYVVHLQQDDLSGIKMEEFSSFISDDVCSKSAIYRLDLDEKEIQTMMEEINEDLDKKISFDPEFNFENSSTMYCSEWIRHLVVQATDDAAYFPVTKAGDFTYIAPDNLYLNKHTRLICTITHQ